MRTPPQRHRMLIAVAVLALAASIPAVNAIRTRSAQAASAVPGDGTTSASAGASCWGIKQQFPATPDGTYWLNTAALERPQQFACDMTTDGGGWVLLGRGREGWTFENRGQGSPATVQTTTNGPGAFAPAALPDTMVTALLNGTPVSQLADGIRVKRSASADGSTSQDVRLFPTSPTWTWAFQTGQLLDHVTIDGRSYAGSNTYDTYSSVPGQATNGLAGLQGATRMFTFDWVNHGYRRGFSYGNGINGSSNGTSFLWTLGTESHAIPFAQVWIRPRVANDAGGFAPIPSGGYAASAKPASLKNNSEVAPWGVVGLDHTNELRIEPYNTAVTAMRTSGNTMFVGGRFTGVQQGPSGASVAQPYLAAFDLGGNWLSGFRPQLDGRVWDMLTTPDGKLVIAGDFTNVNGVPGTSGLAKIDPSTGAPVSGFKANFTKANGARPLVRALAQRDGWIYAAGGFTTVTGGTWAPITVSSAVSVRASDGQPGSWRPRIAAQAVRIRVTKAGDRVLMGGYFNAVNGDTNHGYYAITDIATGNPVAGIGPWTDSIGSGAKYQQAVDDLGDGRYLVGGAEHDFQMWDRNRTALLDSTITKQGGDTQAIEQFGGKVYFACHCGSNVYEGTNNWSSPQGFRAVKPINLVTAVDPATFQVDTSWFPGGLKGDAGEGVWTIEPDNRGCLWVGGDLNRGAYSGNAATDWLGGFARFCQEDTTPPTAPSGLTATMAGNTANLSWNGSTDASGTVSYDVYRNDRVIATVYGTTFADPDVSGPARYTVRASDARGNRSASPAPIAVNGPSQRIATAVAFGSTWRYRDDGSDQGTAWRTPSFNDSVWAGGPGRLGWGTTGNATTLSATHPLTTYYRTNFAVADAAQVKAVSLQLRVLTGAVVYVNGVESGRVNMPNGPITAASTAAGYLTTAQEAATNSLTIPGSLLTTGTNTLSVEVHNMRAGSSRGWFDLEASLYGAGGETNPPSAPTLAVSNATPIALSWTPATDDVALGGYIVRRDGASAAVVGPQITSWTDPDADASMSHTYQAIAYDTAGNERPSKSVVRAPQADSALLTYGAPWRWTFPSGGAPAGWSAVGFDDTTWASGAAELGFGDADERTVISTAPAPRPVTAYFRGTVTVPDPAAFTTITAEMIRDDGAVLYVNGVEVGRNNMPAGPIAPNTVASATITDRAQELTPATFQVPSSAFHAGANSVAVEIHGSDPYTGDLSFDLKLTGQR